MAGLILKAPYYKHGHKSSTGRQRGNLLEYVATRDGVDLVRGDMVNYIGNRKGSCGLFSDDGVTGTKMDRPALNEIVRHLPNPAAWRRRSKSS